MSNLELSHLLFRQQSVALETQKEVYQRVRGETAKARHDRQQRLGNANELLLRLFVEKEAVPASEADTVTPPQLTPEEQAEQYLALKVGEQAALLAQAKHLYDHRLEGTPEGTDTQARLQAVNDELRAVIDGPEQAESPIPD